MVPGIKRRAPGSRGNVAIVPRLALFVQMFYAVYLKTIFELLAENCNLKKYQELKMVKEV